MQQVGRLILFLVLMTAFADLVPTFQDFLEPHTQVSGTFAGTDALEFEESEVLNSNSNLAQVTDPAQNSDDHHHDGPCVGGHCHLGHCAFLAVSAPVVRFAGLQIRYEIQDSQIPASPILDSMKRPPRA